MDDGRNELAEQLVQLAREALIDLDWESVRSFSDSAMRIDPQHGYAEKYLRAANEALKGSVHRVSLHNELLAILKELGTNGMSCADLAAQVNARGRYQRRDGREVPPEQVRARIFHKAYRHLFPRKKNGLVYPE